MTCTQGALTRMLVETGASPHTFDSSSELTVFQSEGDRIGGVWQGIGSRRPIVHFDSIRGTRSQNRANTAHGHYEVGGTLQLLAAPDILDNWLPRILGAAESADVFSTADALPQFGMLIDRGGDIFEVSDCMVNYAVLSADIRHDSPESDIVWLTMNIWGKDESDGQSWPGTPPARNFGANAAPYVFADCSGAFTMQSTAREVVSFELVVANQLKRRWVNSLTATHIWPTDRIVRLRCLTKFSSAEQDLFGQSLEGAAGTFVFTNGGMSITISIDALQAGSITPGVRGRREVYLPIEGFGRIGAGPEEITITNDSVA